MLDRLDRLRHDTVVGGHHEDDDIGRLGTTSTHGGKRCVTRRVQEGDATMFAFDVVGTDMLGDATGFASRDLGATDEVEQRGLAVVDMAHHRHDRRARLHVRLVVLGPSGVDVRRVLWERAGRK